MSSISDLLVKLGRTYIPGHTRIVNGRPVAVDGYWRKTAGGERDDFGPPRRGKGEGLQQRLGRCYELAGRFVMQHNGTTLVHGSIQGMGNPRLDHAWVELPNGDIYDAVLDEKFSPFVHKAFFRAEEKARYPYEKAIKMMLRNRHWGPWDE